MVETARTLKSKAPAYLIGSIPVRTSLALAPMDGFSDSPFRRIAKRHGAGLLFTEFINAIDVIADNPNLKEKLVFHPEERPIGFQLFDNQLERLLQASKKIFSRYRPDFIDVNLGCPNRRVTSRGAGAALLKKPDEVGRLIETLSREIDLPITAKIRLGPNENEKNFLEIAHVIENNGGQCVSLHARTTEQGLKGPAEWEAILLLKQELNIPVIGNGGIQTPDHIDKMERITNCDAVMIGRSAIGNPWIFSHLEPEKVSRKEIKYTLIEHLDLSLQLYGCEKGLIVFRKHASAYLRSLNLSKEKLKELLTCLEYKKFIAAIIRV